MLQTVADVATGQSPVKGPRTAEVIAARVAARPDFDTLGPVDRREIDEVLGPDGMIGAAGLAEWTAPRRPPADLG